LSSKPIATTKNKDELQPEAKKLEQEVQAEQRRGDRFDSAKPSSKSRW
jgi:hypothetical protein